MPLDTFVMSYSGALVGVIAAILVLSLCIAVIYALKMTQALLWQVVEPPQPIQEHKSPSPG